MPMVSKYRFNHDQSQLRHEKVSLATCKSDLRISAVWFSAKYHGYGVPLFGTDSEPSFVSAGLQIAVCIEHISSLLIVY